MRSYWRTAEFEFELGDGRYLTGSVRGQVIPSGPEYPNAYSDSEEVTDMTIEARVYANDEDSVGIEVEKSVLTEAQLSKLTDTALEALCGN